jgi:predicted PurR-regulated permease PerM
MGVLSIIPVLGAFVVWMPAAVYLAGEGDWSKALILAAWGTFAVGLIDNFLYPVLVGSRMRLHTLPVFVSIVGGLFLFGAAGVVIGPVILSATITLLDILRRRTAHGQSAEHQT